MVGDPIPGAAHDAHGFAAPGPAAKLAGHDALGDNTQKLKPVEHEVYANGVQKRIFDVVC